MEQCHKGALVVLWRVVQAKPPKLTYPLEVPLAQMSPSTESKQPFASLINTYYFYTETLCEVGS